MDKKFGNREVCDVTFEKISGVGPESFRIDSAKMSTLEGAATSVYAQGGWGNPRRVAWEGEKTLTFTIEDALITKDSLSALSGAKWENVTGGQKLTVKTTSFAGTYKITATTLFRDEDNIDHATTIEIPKAKLQTTLNISMAPTGDPSTFTFTFDALPNEKKELYSLTILTDAYTEGQQPTDKIFVHFAGEVKEVTGETAVLSVEGTSVKVAGQPFTKKLQTNGKITDFSIILGDGEQVTLQANSRTNWYEI